MPDFAVGRIRAPLHLSPYLPVGVAERHPSEHKAVYLLYREDMIIFRIFEYAVAHSYMRKHEFGHLQAITQLFRSGEEYILHQLKIPVISQRKIGSEQCKLVGDGLKTVALAAHDLENVGVLLVGHYAGSGGEIVGERHEAEITAHPHAHIHGQMPERRGYRGYCGRHRPLGLSTAHLRSYDIEVRTRETEKTGCHVAVERERRP